MNNERESAVLAIGENLTQGPRTYITIGVMRGGTSMVAGVLRGLGLDLGPEVSEQNHESALFTRRSDVAGLKSTLLQYNQTNDVWGWKFPHAADYLNDIWDDIVNPHLICVFRDPAANARGLHRWGSHDDSFKATNASLQRQQKNLNLVRQKGAPALFVSYEKAERHKRQFVTELAAWTGLEADFQSFDFEGFMAAESYKNVADYRKK